MSDELTDILAFTVEQRWSERSPSAPVRRLNPQWLAPLEGLLAAETKVEPHGGPHQAVDRLDVELPAGSQALVLPMPSQVEKPLLLCPVTSTSLTEGDGLGALMGAVRLRARLPAPSRIELVLVLIGPPGSDCEGCWLGARRMFERNEAICRVLVWLPPREYSDIQRSAMSVVDRLFIGELPNLSSNMIDLAPTEALLSGDSLPGSVRREWTRLLLDPNLRPVERADKMIAQLEEGPDNESR